MKRLELLRSLQPHLAAIDRRLAPLLAAWQAASRSWWAGALVVLIFAACFLQFARIGSYRRPHETRINDGREATFFAVHLNPYYLFSEDFHLYVVRGKRILSRGWSNSLLFAPEETEKNYAAPLQAALGMLAAQTDGRPLPYAIFITGILAAAWLSLYAVGRIALRGEVSRPNLLLIVLITVLFESLQYVPNPHVEFDPWPVFRGLRTSTLAWSNPLLLSVVLCGASLAFRRRSSLAFKALLGTGLLLLSLSDNWAFMLAWGTIAVVWWLIAGGLLQRISLLQRRRQMMRLAAVSAILLVTAVLFALQTGGIRGDALARGGLGRQWQTLGIWIPRENWQLIGYDAALAAAALVLGIVTLRMQLARRVFQWSLTFQRGPSVRRRSLAAAIAWMPLLASILIVAAFSWIGSDPYHARQFQWRAEYCVLFAAGLLALEWVRRSVLRRLPAEGARWLSLALPAVAVVALLGYHYDRIHDFVKETAARDFHLTRDEEGLRDWLASYSRTRPRFSLATASHEINLLCAYWTDADLCLPSGFPYHCGSSRKRLETRAADVMRLYNVSPQQWLDFNLHMHADDQWSWGQSRLLSARQGYMYYLLHREVWMRGYPSGLNLGAIRYSSREGTTERIAQVRAVWRAAFVSAAMKSIEVDEGKEVARQLLAERSAGNAAYEWLEELGGLRSFAPAASVEGAERIAERIVSSQRPVPAPDVIVIDEVSRALGEPDLSAYERAYSSPSIEAWVRKVPHGIIATRP